MELVDCPSTLAHCEMGTRSFARLGTPRGIGADTTGLALGFETLGMAFTTMIVRMSGGGAIQSYKNVVFCRLFRALIQRYSAPE